MTGGVFTMRTVSVFMKKARACCAAATFRAFRGKPTVALF
jgi:hypothetical protein